MYMYLKSAKLARGCPLWQDGVTLKRKWENVKGRHPRQGYMQLRRELLIGKAMSPSQGGMEVPLKKRGYTIRA